MDKKATKVSEDAKKAKLVNRLMEVAIRKGVFICVFDGPAEMVQSVEDMRLGREVREAIAAERARLESAKAATEMRH